MCMILGGVILISELGYNISGLIAGLGIGGVAIALAAQDTASNILGALMIILDIASANSKEEAKIRRFLS